MNELEQAIDQFCADSHSITVIEEPEQDRIRYRVELKQPHVMIYLILGDVLQCLRTALDQAVWSLIYHRTGIDSQASEFPIFSSAPKQKMKFDQKTNGLPDKTIAYIESIQPYNHLPTSNYPLWQLHELNRIDKHRRISVRSQFATAERHYFGAVSSLENFSPFETKKLTEDNWEIICSGTSKYRRPQINSLVLFGEADITMDLHGVRRIYDFVHRVLVELASFAIPEPNNLRLG